MEKVFCSMREQNLSGGMKLVDLPGCWVLFEGELVERIDEQWEKLLHVAVVSTKGRADSVGQ